MTLLFLIFSGFISHAEIEKNKPEWKPVGYEKIKILKKDSESINFIKSEKNGQVSYSLAYEINSKTIRKRIIPIEVYSNYKNRFETEVNAHAQRPKQIECEDKIERTIKVTSKNKPQTSFICLKITGEETMAEINFRKWYMDARKELGL